jgi:hypothetical protein
MVMGLESSTLRGVAANPMSDTDSQCSLEPNAYNQYEPFSYTAIFLMTMVFLGVVLFMARTFRWAKDAYDSYEHSYGVMAMTDSLVDRLCNENKTLRGEFNEMKNQIAELQRGQKLLESQDDILSDQADSLHYGLVMLGGYTIHSELTPAQRQHMFTIERANLVAARTMLANRYMSIVMQQNRGVAFGDDTDMMENPIGASSMGEGAESEAPTFDPTVPVSEASGELTRIHDTLRQELNSFLARENWEEAAEIQRCIMMVLDSLNIGQPLERGARIRLYQQLGDRLEHVADRQRVSNEALIAERFQRYANQLRENAFAE